MSLKIVTEQFVLTTTGTPTYTQDLTTSKLGGLTPKACMFICNGAIADDTLRDDAWSSIAFLAASASRIVHNSIEDNTANQTINWAYSSGLVIWLTNGSGTNQARGTFNSYITNGVRVNLIDINPTAAYKITVVFFAGTDLSVHLTQVDPSDTLDGTIETTGVGFKPDAIMSFGSTSESNYGQNMFGVSTRLTDTTASEGVVNCTWKPSAATGTNRGAHRDDCFSFEHGLETSDTKARFTVSAWGTGGYTIKTINSNALAATRLICLALKFGPYACKMVHHECITTTGNDDETSLSFPPGFMLGYHSVESTVNTYRASGGQPGNFGFLTYDGADSYSSQIMNESGVATINSNQHISKDATCLGHSGVDYLVGTTSWLTNGWRWNWTTNFGSTILVQGFAIQGAVTGTGAISATVPTLSATGKATAKGTGAISATLPTLSATGKATATGTGAISATLPTLAGTGKTVAAGTCAIAATVPTLAIVGLVGVAVTGTCAILATVPTLEASGKATVTGTCAISATVPTLAVTGKATGTGTCAIASTIPTLSSIGKVTATGTGAINATIPTLAGAGSVASPVVTGTVAISATPPTLAATGKATAAGGVEIASTVPTLDSTGKATVIGDCDITVTVPVLSGTGKATVLGTGDISSTVPIIYGTGAGSVLATISHAGSGAGFVHFLNNIGVMCFEHIVSQIATWQILVGVGTQEPKGAGGKCLVKKENRTLIVPKENRVFRA